MMSASIQIGAWRRCDTGAGMVGVGVGAGMAICGAAAGTMGTLVGCDAVIASGDDPADSVLSVNDVDPSPPA